MEKEILLSAMELKKAFGSFVAADVPAFSVRKGEFFTIVGPSGSGKTTLLGMLTGTVRPTSGRITIRGEDVTDLPPERRPTAMVFQSLALFPHMTVGENIGFALEVKGIGRTERRGRILELMDQLHLPQAYFDKGVKQCSGGERQRVAIARVLAHNSDIVFFDEPLSAIDYRLRKTLEVELMEVHRATGKTFIFVTHSLEEAMTMSDRMAIMRDGKIIQTGSARDIYNTPANEFVAQFLGEVNLFDVTMTRRSDDTMTLSCAETAMTIEAKVDDRLSEGGSARLVVRPENMSIIRSGTTLDNVLEVRIQHRLVLGSRIQFEAYAGTKQILIEELARVRVQGDEPIVGPGEVVKIGWNADGGILVHD